MSITDVVQAVVQAATGKVRTAPTYAFRVPFADYFISMPPPGAPPRQLLDFAALMSLGVHRKALDPLDWERMGAAYRKTWEEP